MTREFILKKNRPCHIQEITDYVTQYRITNRKSVLENMRNVQKDPFLFLGDGISDEKEVEVISSYEKNNKIDRKNIIVKSKSYYINFSKSIEEPKISSTH